MTTLDEPRVRRYLLGQMSEEDATHIEREYFGGGDALDRVWSIENDLVDAYVKGELESADRSAFEGHYLSSPLHRDRVASARALRAAMGGLVAQPVPRSGTRTWTPWLALAAAVLLVVAGWWLRTRPEPHTTSVAQVPRSPPPAGSATPASVDPSLTLPTPPASRKTVVAAFALSPVLLRSNQETPVLRFAPGTDELAITLEGERSEGVPSGARLPFVVTTVEGATLVRGRTHPGPTALGIARIATERLPRGDYILSVFPPEPETQEAPLRQYFFRVLPR